MSIENDNIAVVKEYFDRVAAGDLSVIDELFSPYFKSNDEFVPSNLEELKRNLAEDIYAIEYSNRSDTYSAKNDLVTVHTMFRSRLVRPYLNGKVVDNRWYIMTDVSVWRVTNGRISEFVSADTKSALE
jgi:ketosteroid isomerase-like protein